MESGKRKIVLVGASRGIGAAVAQHFAQKGDSYSQSPEASLSQESGFKQIFPLQKE